MFSKAFSTKPIDQNTEFLNQYYAHYEANRSIPILNVETFSKTEEDSNDDSIFELSDTSSEYFDDDSIFELSDTSSTITTQTDSDSYKTPDETSSVFSDHDDTSSECSNDNSSTATVYDDHPEPL